jgi:RNA polymerase sigma factor (sigma-70 family)
MSSEDLELSEDSDLHPHPPPNCCQPRERGLKDRRPILASFPATCNRKRLRMVTFERETERSAAAIDSRAAERSRALVCAAAAGDEAAWAELVATYDSLIRGVVRRFRLDKDASEDVVQTTWQRLVEHIKHVRRPECIRSWLYTTARNESLRATHRARREKPMKDDVLEALADIGILDDDFEDLDEGLIERVRRAVRTLSSEQQDLLHLVVVADPSPSYREIAALLGRPVGSIGPTLGRCLDKLRRAIAVPA